MEIILQNNRTHPNEFSSSFVGHVINFADEIYPTDVICDSLLKEYIKNIYSKTNQALPKITVKDTDLKVTLPTNKEKILIGFSGGKDGVAVAILAKELGFTPTLYHLYGVNRTYRKEVENAEKIAAHLGIELVKEHIDIKGKQHFPDHPFKNQLIINHMLDYGISKGITNYALGNHNFESIAGANVRLEFSDSGEQIQLFDKYIKSKFENYSRITYLEDNVQALNIIARKDPSLFNIISSCVFPPYRKPMVRKNVIAKYGESVLLEGRCGCYCYKCTKEYIVLSELGILPYIKEYYDRCEDWQKTKSPVSYN